MSDVIRRAIREIAGSEQATSRAFTATVVEVEGEVCELLPDDGGPPVYDARLRPVIDGAETGILMIPAADARVLAIWLDDQTACVLAASAYDRYEIALENANVSLESGKVVVVGQSSTVELAGDGILIQKGSETLLGLLNDLLTQLTVMAPISAAPGAPSVPNPVDVTQFNLIKTRFQTLLK